MQDGALVLARAPTRVPVRVQVGLVRLKEFEGGVGVHFEDDDHEGAHEVGRVGQLGEVGGARVVVYARRPLKALRLEQLLQLAAEAVRHGEVQRAEILVERHIGQILRSQKVASVRDAKLQTQRETNQKCTYIIDVKEEGIVDVGRWLRVRYPVQLVYKKK